MINIVEKLDKQAEKQIKQYPHPNNRASEAGHPCEKFLVLARLMPEKKALHDVGLQKIFNEGNLHEKAVIREMEDAGFEVIEQQRSFEWKKFKLTGHIDGKLVTENGLIPLEIKSCSDNVFRTIKDLNPMEFLKSKYPWVRKYPAQILLYMMMDGKEYGIMVFKNKTTGQKLQFTFTLEYEYLETILKKLERVNAYCDAGEIPEAVASDECKRCGFCGTVCYPDQDCGPGFEYYDDEVLIKKLDRREFLTPATSERKALDDELRGSAGKPGLFYGKNVVIGNYIIETRNGRTKIIGKGEFK